jgi:hypothetical protein
MRKSLPLHFAEYFSMLFRMRCQSPFLEYILRICSIISVCGYITIQSRQLKKWECKQLPNNRNLPSRGTRACWAVVLGPVSVFRSVFV